MRKKLKDASGLTMVEMLCAVVILVLLCLMTNTGMHMAVANYRTLTGEAEAQLLLSSLSDALADKLRYCVVTVDKDTGAYKKCSICSIEPLSTSVKADSTTHRVTVNSKELLPEGAYGEKTDAAGGNRRYQATEASITEPSSYVVGERPEFTVKLKVEDTQTNLTKETTLTVRCLNPVKKEGPP